MRSGDTVSVAPLLPAGVKAGLQAWQDPGTSSRRQSCGSLLRWGTVQWSLLGAEGQSPMDRQTAVGSARHRNMFNILKIVYGRPLYRTSMKLGRVLGAGSAV